MRKMVRSEIGCVLVTFHEAIITVIKNIPHGKVASYGQIAGMVGNPRGARQVVRALHASSGKEKLPWHRVVNSKGTISLPVGAGYELQKALLKREGVQFDESDRIDLGRFQWNPRKFKIR